MFEDGEQRIVRDVLTHIDGDPYAEWYSVCPVCGGDFEEAEECKRCGGHFAPDKMIARLYCRECLDELMTPENMERYVREDEDNFAEWLYEEAK